VPAYVDTHCHLEMHDDLDPAALIKRAHEQGVTTLITVGTDMARSTQAVTLAHRHREDGVYAVVGVHPNDAMEATHHVMEVIERLAGQKAVVGIGETGMDFYRRGAAPGVQERSFRRHIELAKKHDKTLVIHCRDAWPDTLRILEDEGAPDRVVMHCFSGDLDVTDRCIDEGWYLSFAGNVTFKTADELRAVAAKAPAELLLTETDSPFLTPVPHRGEPNEPANIPHVVTTLAEVRGVEPDALAEQIVANARTVFDLPGA
jgi:TatD DNase family protein